MFEHLKPRKPSGIMFFSEIVYSQLYPKIKSLPRYSIEVREESYGFTLAHCCNGRVLYAATYKNNYDAMRQVRRIADQEQADDHYRL